MLGFIKSLFKKNTSNDDALIKTAQPICCPYCGVVFDDPPARSKKCPECKKKMVRRKEENGNIVLLTEEQGQSFDAVEAYFRSVDVIGIGRDKFIEFLKYAEKETKQTTNIREAYWSYVGNFTNSAIKAKNYHVVRTSYYEQSRILKDIEKRNFFGCLSQAFLYDLMHHAEMASAFGGVRSKVEICAYPRCRKAQTLAGKIYTIKEAIELAPLPPRDCDLGYCRCFYSYRLD